MRALDGGNRQRNSIEQYMTDQTNDTTNQGSNSQTQGEQSTDTNTGGQNQPRMYTEAELNERLRNKEAEVTRKLGGDKSTTKDNKTGADDKLASLESTVAELLNRTQAAEAKAQRADFFAAAAKAGIPESIAQVMHVDMTKPESWTSIFESVKGSIKTQDNGRSSSSIAGASSSTNLDLTNPKHWTKDDVRRIVKEEGWESTLERLQQYERDNGMGGGRINIPLPKKDK